MTRVLKERYGSTYYSIILISSVYLRLDALLEMVDIIEAEKALLLLESSHFGFPLTILPLRRNILKKTYHSFLSDQPLHCKVFEISRVNVFPTRKALFRAL